MINRDKETYPIIPNLVEITSSKRLESCDDGETFYSVYLSSE